jgi:type II secretory pathway component PulK
MRKDAELGSMQVVALYLSCLMLLLMMPHLVKMSLRYRLAERGFHELQALYLAEGAIDMAVWQLNETGEIRESPEGADVMIGPVSEDLSRFLVAGATIPFAGQPVREIVKVKLQQFMIVGGLPRWRVVSWQRIGWK